MEEVYDFLKRCGIFYIATIDGDKPRVRPFGVVNIYEKKLYIQTGKIKRVSKQIQINPNIEICGYIDNKWLRVEAKAIRDDRREAKKSILDANSGLAWIRSATLLIIGWIVSKSFWITGNNASQILAAVSEKVFFNSANLSAIVWAGSQNSSNAFLHSTRVAFTKAWVFSAFVSSFEDFQSCLA